MNEELIGKEEPNPDLESCFRPVAERFGREMFDLVFWAGMGRSAADTLIAANRSVPRLLHATGLLAQAFNEISNRYAAAKDFDEKDLIACDQAIQLAFATKIQVASPSIIITH